MNKVTKNPAPPPGVDHQAIFAALLSVMRETRRIMAPENLTVELGRVVADLIELRAVYYRLALVADFNAMQCYDRCVARLANVIGMNAPSGAHITLHQTAKPAEEPSTTRIAATFERLLGLELGKIGRQATEPHRGA